MYNFPPISAQRVLIFASPYYDQGAFMHHALRVGLLNDTGAKVKILEHIYVYKC